MHQIEVFTCLILLNRKLLHSGFIEQSVVNDQLLWLGTESYNDISCRVGGGMKA